MFKNLDVFKMSHAMAVHAGQKQAVAAQNVANSDTPGYRALDIQPFAQSYNAQSTGTEGAAQRATRSSHLNGSTNRTVEETFVDKEAIASPNGNSVSLETEMLKSLDAKRQHDRALAIYKSALTVLRASISSR